MSSPSKGPIQPTDDRPTIVVTGEETFTSEEDAQFRKMLERATAHLKDVEVLDRSVINERFHVESIPEDLHYEWVVDHPAAIDEMKTNGFIIDTVYGKASSLTFERGAFRIGDTLLMITTKENYLRRERQLENLRKRRHGITTTERRRQLQQEENEALSSASTEGVVPFGVESASVKIEGIDNIKKAIST